MKPLISIIIPTYKRSKYLVKLVNNLITNNINFKYFEIIICDSDKQKSDYLKLVSADIVETCLEELTKQISSSSGVEHQQPEGVDKKSFSLFKRKVKKPK